MCGPTCWSYIYIDVWPPRGSREAPLRLSREAPRGSTHVRVCAPRKISRFAHRIPIYTLGFGIYTLYVHPQDISSLLFHSRAPSSGPTERSILVSCVLCTRIYATWYLSYPMQHVSLQSNATRSLQESVVRLRAHSRETLFTQWCEEK